MKSVCLAILNYNGKKHLQHLLPTAVAAAANFPGPCSLVVLDNRSTDDDVEWLKREFPGIETIVAPENDFLYSYNRFAEGRPEDILIFLNNDLKLPLDFIAPLARHFVFADVFAVSATSRDWNDTIFTCGPCRLQSHHGDYRAYWDLNRQELQHTFFCCGGFMAADRKKFLALGGFNRLFYPAYGEDLDLCFRAWREGWRCIFAPASRVLHRENGSWSQNDNSRPARLNLRAQLLFQWSSLPPAGSWLERTAFYLARTFREALRGNFWWSLVWLATWREWRIRRAQYRWMMTSQAELDSILPRIDEPVRPPPP
jgi:GT2 family glycosyltransferase